MSFYPLFNINENKGFVKLANFAPNDWEKVPVGVRNVHAFHTNGRQWRVDKLGAIPENEFRCFNSSDFLSMSGQVIEDVRIEDLVFLDMRVDILPDQMAELPPSDLPSTHWPEWRATIGLKSENSMVSYQGEINPTPPKATLLTFHPFIQFEDITNYFVFVNMEKSPVYRWSEIDIYHSGSNEKVDTKKVRNNAANIIALDQYGFTPADLPIFYCKGMAGIPFGFGKSISTGMLSFEHTHPPGSLTLHGNRFTAQKEIKVGWVNHLQIG